MLMYARHIRTGKGHHFQRVGDTRGADAAETTIHKNHRGMDLLTEYSLTQ